jgi:cobalt-precorrin-5B (C1)-methyltransferase
MKKKLRYGYTTGACAATAAKGAAQMLASQAFVNEVSINLPAGVSATFQLHGQSFSVHEAGCFVIKDAGDDPDVTHGAEVWARVSQSPHPHPGPPLEGEGAILITGGVGIGQVTKPGLAVPPGEWAINPVPRSMIEESVRSVFSSLISHPSSIQIVISIPDGEERAKKTLNQRLGIIGGLSILGTTGIVRPISAKAWTDTIDAALDVARACGCETVVLSTGRTSEMAAQKFLKSNPPQSPLVRGEVKAPPLTRGGGGGVDVILPEEAFIMMGDHITYALRACAMRGFARPIIACQFAKLIKIACGHENTHAAASELDLVTLKGWAEEAGLSAAITSVIATAHTAREIAIATGFDMKLMKLVTIHAEQTAVGHASDIGPRFLVCGYDGNVVQS